MQNCRDFVTLATFVVCCCGCTENPFSGAFSSNASTDDVATDDVATVAADTVPSSVTTMTGDPNQNRFRQRIGVLFESVLPTLDQTRELVDRHAGLPDDSRIPFKTDKKSNSAEINELLDQAIDILSSSTASDFRKQIRDSNAAIAASQEQIADYRRQRISASWAKDQSQLDKVNPFESSKESLDELIVAEKSNIESEQESLIELKKSFVEELSKIGVQVDDDGVESLLSSVSGDDIVTMAVVFDNIKHVTGQLQKLTEESGEALEVSKRYYGMYVVMIHVMDRIQKTFVRDIKERHVPKLTEFASQADKNMKQAKALIELDGGDRKLLEANIRSNQLTRQTANLYIEYLKRNAALVATENKRAQKNIATAMNTYETVKLSSDVADLMNTGRRDFETLMKLQVPALREFNNEAIRKEFKRMTFELRSGE